MTNAEKKTLSYSLFVKSSFSRKEIAKQVGCTEKTLRKWINDGKWDSIRDSQNLTSSKLLQDSYAQLKAINNHIKEELNGLPNKEMSDAKAVIRKEIEALSNNPLHKYVEVFTEFTDWMTLNHAKQSLNMLSLIDEFINELATKEGI